MGRIHHVEYNDCRGHQRSIECDKESFIDDEIAAPSLAKLNGSVNTSDKDEDDGEGRSGHNELDVVGYHVVAGVEEDKGKESSEYGDGKHLEDNTAHLVSNQHFQTQDRGVTVIITMVAVPGCVFAGGTLFEAEEARPPPMAWITIEMRSQVQKIHKYSLGESGDVLRPKIGMRRERIT